MLTNTNNEMNNNQEYNRLEESTKRLEALMNRTLTIKPQLPEGNNEVTFKGIGMKEFKNAVGVKVYDGFCVKVQLADTEYDLDMPFSAKDNESAVKQDSIYAENFQKIGHQFGLVGDFRIVDINKFIGKTFWVNINIKDGKRHTNYYKAKETSAVQEMPKF